MEESSLEERVNCCSEGSSNRTEGTEPVNSLELKSKTCKNIKSLKLSGVNAPVKLLFLIEI